ncbi:MAG: glycosyltransferase family 39 protein [Nitrospirota bacterium]
MNLAEADRLLFFFVNKDLQNHFLDILMPFLTNKSYLIFLPLFFVFLLKERKHAIIAFVLAFASLLIADWLSNTLKYAIERIRPCNDLYGVRLLINCSKSFSMPSNHAVNAFAFATPFYVLLRSRLRIAFVILACLVAFSRVYVGVHYPSDIFTGSIIGILFAIASIKIYHWSSQRFLEKPHTTVLLLFLLCMSLFRIYYILHGPLDLSPDEAHYWEWSRRLDMSYYSKGPMIAYLIHLGTGIFGDTVFGVRIMAVVFSGLSSLLLYSLGRHVYNPDVGLFSAILFQIIPLFSAYGVIFTIDSPFIFFWILSLYLFWQALPGMRAQHSGVESHSLLSPLIGKRNSDLSMLYWCLLGLSVGLGMLTKYTMAFFYLCAFLFLLLNQDKRTLFLSKGPYTAFIISLAVFSPVILWNAGNDWVTFRHTAGQAHIAEGMQLSLRSFFEFLGSQLGVLTPLILIIMGISLWRTKSKKEGSFLFWFSFPVILFFLLKSLQAKVQANWALPGYITGVIAFCAFSAVLFRRGNAGKILLATAIVLSLTVTAVAHYPSMLGIPGRLDPTERLRGWEQLGDEVTGIYEKMSTNNKVFIFSDKYQVASELAFYVKGNPVTYCINLDRRMNQYDLWPGLEEKRHQDAIFVRTGDTGMPEKVAGAFEKVEKKVFTAYTKKRDKIRDYSLFICYAFKGLKQENPETY